jgi:hypothetical protein
MRAENYFDIQSSKVGLAKRIAMLVAIVLVVGGALTPPLCAQVASNRYERELQPLIQRFVQKQQVPGLAIAIIKNNRIVYAHAFGVQNLSKTNDPMTTRSLFHMASITKLFVGPDPLFRSSSRQREPPLSRLDFISETNAGRTSGSRLPIPTRARATRAQGQFASKPCI